MHRRDVLARSERYADDMPLSLLYRQLPPTSEPASKQSKGMPRACSTWHAAIPDDPAPITHTRFMSAITRRMLHQHAAARISDDPETGPDLRDRTAVSA